VGRRARRLGRPAEHHNDNAALVDPDGARGGVHPPGRARRPPGAALEADGINAVCIVMQDPEGNEFCLD
jgi:hypothetical protein